MTARFVVVEPTQLMWVRKICKPSTWDCFHYSDKAQCSTLTFKLTSPWASKAWNLLANRHPLVARFEAWTFALAAHLLNSTEASLNKPELSEVNTNVAFNLILWDNYWNCAMQALIYCFNQRKLSSYKKVHEESARIFSLHFSSHN